MPIEASFPLAPTQRGLHFIHQRWPDCGAYHLVFSCQLTGPGIRWQAATSEVLERLLARHPILRVAFPPASAEAAQCVFEGVAPALHWTDATPWDDETLRAQMRHDARQPFRLDRPPLWRVHLYRREAGRWGISVVAHHLLLDFWSLGLLVQEAAAEWGVLPEQPIADGAGFLQGLQGAVSTAPPLSPPARAHWQSALQDCPATHALSLDHARPAHPVHEGKSLRFMLDAKTSAAAQALAQREQATPYMVFLAAHVAWLHRLSGQRDWVIASPVAGRGKRTQWQQLGQFVNTLPLRLRLEPGDSFLTLLARVKRVVIEAQRHAEVPFSTLVEHFAPARGTSLDPLTQLGFSWEKLPTVAGLGDFFLPVAPACAVHHAGPWAIEPFHVPQQEGQLDLVMEMGGQLDGCWVGSLKYRDALWAEETIQAWLAVWQHGLRQWMAHPGQALAQAGWLPPETTAVDQGPLDCWAPGHTLPWLLHAIERHGSQVAVEDAQQRLSYRSLHLRAQAIAHALQRHGVGPQDHVGVLLTRTVDLPAAMLGIWLLRAVYVPLDPAHPPERLAFVAEDAALKAVLCTRQHAHACPAATPLLTLDGALPAPPQPLQQSQPPMDAQDVAYLMYTSGSTGRPKGVRVAHRSLWNLLQSLRERLGLDAGTRCLAVTTPSFDISLLELLLPLGLGGTVVVAAEQHRADGQALADWIAERRINLMQATPITWKLLVQSGWPGQPGLRALCGGEALPPALAEQLLQRGLELWNVYGPTETTIWSTAARVLPGQPIQLGLALHHTQLHVLDEQQQPVPLGVAGELWIGGEGVALDYWRRPELTAERFRVLPQLPQAGRLYRTGDKVRRNSRGGLEHHGRLDTQVKLRGHRIELQEIESTILEQPAWQDAAAAVHELPTQGACLVGYLVPRAEVADLAQAQRDLRQHLQARLPAPMQPAHWVLLQALPQTPNHKLDRARLPPPSVAQRPGRCAPADAAEIQLCGLFERLLGLEAVGTDEDFFDLGGHSLLAMQLLTSIKSDLGIDLPLSELPRPATVQALAERIRQGSTAAAPSCRVLLKPGAADQRPVWLFHPIGGGAFCYLELARRSTLDRPLWALQSPGLHDPDEAEVSVAALARRYVAALRELQPQGPYALAGWCFGGVVALEAALQLQQQGEPVEHVSLIDSRAPLAAHVPPGGDDAMLLSWFARDLALPHGKVLSIEPDRLRGLPPEAMFDVVLEGARDLGIWPRHADASQLQRHFETYLANGIALQTHLPPPLQQALPVTLIKARDEPDDWVPRLGWEQLLCGPWNCVEVPGDHQSVMQAPHAQELARVFDAIHAQPEAVDD